MASVTSEMRKMNLRCEKLIVTQVKHNVPQRISTSPVFQAAPTTPATTTLLPTPTHLPPSVTLSAQPASASVPSSSDLLLKTPQMSLGIVGITVDLDAAQVLFIE